MLTGLAGLFLFLPSDYKRMFLKSIKVNNPVLLANIVYGPYYEGFFVLMRLSLAEDCKRLRGPDHVNLSHDFHLHAVAACAV